MGEDKSGGAGRKKLDASYVDAAHFGGFLTKSDAEYESGKGNTRKDWIEQMIADSKKRKAEKSKDLEEAEEMTQALDEKWKELLPNSAISGKIYSGKKQDEEENDHDDYNKLMRELMFQSTKKAVAQERLKTDEEIIKDEKERLEKLESDRNRRMKGEAVTEGIDEAMNDGEESSLEDKQQYESDSIGESDNSDESDGNDGSGDEDDQYSDLDSDEEDKTAEAP